MAKIPESKTPQSYNCYEILAQFLSPQLIPDLLTPVREVSHCCYSYAHMYMHVYMYKYESQGGKRPVMLFYSLAAVNVHMNRIEGSIHTYICTPHIHCTCRILIFNAPSILGYKPELVHVSV